MSFRVKAGPVPAQPAPRAVRTSLVVQVLAEVKWSFTPPWTWLTGVGANLVLSLAWLVAVPLTGRRHSDWAIVIGTYFAVFILADVTTTNVLGADAVRVRAALLRGIALFRIILVKNLALVVIVGLPTLALTAIVTINSENDYRLVLTLPGVAFPILTWLGVGNLVSVMLPVAVVPLRRRWLQRHDRVPTVRWLGHLALPYALLYLVDPVGDLPRLIFRRMPGLPHTAGAHGLVLIVLGLAAWALGTVAALGVVRFRHLRIR